MSLVCWFVLALVITLQKLGGPILSFALLFIATDFLLPYLPARFLARCSRELRREYRFRLYVLDYSVFDNIGFFVGFWEGLFEYW